MSEHRYMYERYFAPAISSVERWTLSFKISKHSDFYWKISIFTSDIVIEMQYISINDS